MGFREADRGYCTVEVAGYAEGLEYTVKFTK